MAELATAETRTESLPADVKRAMAGGVISMFVDTYDVYLPALVLPAAMKYFEPPTLPTNIQVTLTTLMFTVTLLGRPVGSLLFGNLSDLFGRKRIAMTAAAGFTLVTLLTALTPGYNRIGYAAIGLVIFFRFAVGVFVAGGYAAPIPLALERSPKHRRAFISGFIACGATAATFLINLIQWILLSKIPQPQFLAWGWRMPFFFGVLLGIAYLIYYSRISELDAKAYAAPTAQRKQPLVELVTGPNLRNFGQVFLLTTGYWLAAQMVVSYMPSFLIGVLHQPAQRVSSMAMVASPFYVILFVLFVWVAQQVGRRRVLIFMGVMNLIFTPCMFYAIIRATQHHAGFWTLAALVFLPGIFTSGPLGVMTLYLNERFPTHIRATGFAVSYMCGLIVPGLYSFWLLWLSHLVPFQYTEMILVCLGGLLAIIGSTLGPETRHVELLKQPGESASV